MQELKETLKQLKRKRDDVDRDIEQCQKRLREYKEYQDEIKQDEIKAEASKAAEYVCNKLIGDCTQRGCSTATDATWIKIQRRLHELVLNGIQTYQYSKEAEAAKGGLFATEKIFAYKFAGGHEMKVRIWDCDDGEVHEKSFECTTHHADKKSTCCKLDEYCDMDIRNPINDPVAFELSDLEKHPEHIPGLFFLIHEELANTDLCYCSLICINAEPP